MESNLSVSSSSLILVGGKMSQPIDTTSTAPPVTNKMTVVVNSLKGVFKSMRDNIRKTADNLKHNVVFNSVVQIARMANEMMPEVGVPDFVKHIADIDNGFIDYFKLNELGGAFETAFDELMKSIKNPDGSFIEEALQEAIDNVPQFVEKTCCQC